ncbi:MAG: ACR3 family arsenite efflux transporter [Actinobacteria bacterium]|nr:ACR3 family arsenite efflux transporter [Actinomycetota bacterium]
MTGPVISDEREAAALGAPAGTVPPAVVRGLSTLDRWLPLWIAVAMGVGLGLGALIPGLESALSAVAIGGTSLPIAIGLLLMMYPVLARVRYEELGRLRAERGLFVSSLVLNWIIGPLLMFTFAWLMLPHEPEYRTGLIVVGLARCIAMVLIWSELACADREATAVLVAINSIFQIVAYSLLGWFYLTVLPGWLGLDTEGFSISIWEVARTVLIFLGIPLAAGYLTRVVGLRRRGREWYEGTFLPRIGPITLYGLLFTIVLLFALQGHQITGHPLDVVKIALPLLAYFAAMFAIAFGWGIVAGYGYPRTATLALTAASNNFELAIAVAIGVFGATSGEALAGVVGPLIEVPVLVGLVYFSLWARGRWFGPQPDPAGAAA